MFFFVLHENTNSQHQGKECTVLENVGMFLIFAQKNLLAVLWDIVSFVTQYVEGKNEQTLIKGRQCLINVSSFSLKYSILKGLYSFGVCKYWLLT